jgi:hypothetical protein
MTREPPTVLYTHQFVLSEGGRYDVSLEDVGPYFLLFVTRSRNFFDPTARAVTRKDTRLVTGAVASEGNRDTMIRAAVQLTAADCETRWLDWQLWGVIW